jgi:pyrroloquinoline quinone (PQQ) biosynthesis protein C
MGEGFGVPPECFDGYVPSNPAVHALHNYLTEIGANGPFPSAVAATSYAAEGMAQRIATKALAGLERNERLGARGRGWLEEHARYDAGRPVLALELVKASLSDRNGGRAHLEAAARRALELLRDALEESYHR